MMETILLIIAIIIQAIILSTFFIMAKNISSIKRRLYHDCTPKEYMVISVAEFKMENYEQALKYATLAEALAATGAWGDHVENETRVWKQKLSEPRFEG